MDFTVRESTHAETATRGTFVAKKHNIVLFTKESRAVEQPSPKKQRIDENRDDLYTSPPPSVDHEHEQLQESDKDGTSDENYDHTQVEAVTEPISVNPVDRR